MKPAETLPEVTHQPRLHIVHRSKTPCRAAPRLLCIDASFEQDHAALEHIIRTTFPRQPWLLLRLFHSTDAFVYERMRHAAPTEEIIGKALFIVSLLKVGYIHIATFTPINPHIINRVF